MTRWWGEIVLKRNKTQPIHWTWLWVSRKVTLCRRHTQGRSLQNWLQASDCGEGKGRANGKPSPRAGAHGGWCQQAPGCALQPGRAEPAVGFSDCTLQLLLDILQQRKISGWGQGEGSGVSGVFGVRPALGNSSRKVISLRNKGLILFLLFPKPGGPLNWKQDPQLGISSGPKPLWFLRQIS